MTLAGWLSVLVVCSLGAMAPGPSLALVLRNTAVGGVASGTATALAHAFGIGLYAAASTAGLAALMSQHPLLGDILALAGAVYLLAIGLAAVRATPAAAPPRTGSRQLGRAVGQGFAMAMVNPKVVVFFVALFSQYVHAPVPATDYVLLVATAVVVDAGWYCVVALAAGRGAQSAQRLGYGRWLTWLTGVVLIAVALVALVSLAADWLG